MFLDARSFAFLIALTVVCLIPVGVAVAGASLLQVNVGLWAAWLWFIPALVVALYVMLWTINRALDRFMED